MFCVLSMFVYVMLSLQALSIKVAKRPAAVKLIFLYIEVLKFSKYQGILSFLVCFFTAQKTE